MTPAQGRARSDTVGTSDLSTRSSTFQNTANDALTCHQETSPYAARVCSRCGRQQRSTCLFPRCAPGSRERSRPLSSRRAPPPPDLPAERAFKRGVRARRERSGPRKPNPRALPCSEPRCCEASQPWVTMGFTEDVQERARTCKPLLRSKPAQVPHCKRQATRKRRQQTAKQHRRNGTDGG